MPKENLFKNDLRKEMLFKIKTLSSERRKKASDEAFSFLKSFLKPFSLVLSFASFPEEVDLWAVNQLLAKEKKLVLSKMEERSLSLFLVDDLEKQLKRYKKKFLEPDPTLCESLSLEKISLILVPAIAFSKDLFRLGYGKGYYDRLLSKKNPNVLAIGIGFYEQLLPYIPIEPHDEKVDDLFLF